MWNTRQCRDWRFCPLCEKGVIGIVNHKAELHRVRMELLEKGNDEMGIERPSVATGDARAHGIGKRSDDWLLYPSLMEFLTEEKYTDGSARQCGTLTVFSDGGSVKASVNDRDLNRVAFITAETFEGLLGLVEDKLKSSSVDWRPSQGKARRK